jgi:hypothetical protein
MLISFTKLGAAQTTMRLVAAMENRSPSAGRICCSRWLNAWIY